MVTWTAPQSVTPDSYSVSVGCLRLCDNVPIFSGVISVTNGGAATSYTINNLDPYVFCTVRVIAMVGIASSLSNEVCTTTLTAGLYYSTVISINIIIYIRCLIHSSSYWCSWNTQYHFSGEEVTHCSVGDSTLP